jgi:putative endopeptidase
MKLALLAASVAACCLVSAAATAADDQVHYGKWGVDLTSRDLAVQPGDSFFNYAEGAWYSKATIPADQASTGTFRDLYNRAQVQLRDLIETAAKNPSNPQAAQIGALYHAFMDEARVEQLDAQPLKPDLARIAAAPDRAAFALLMAKTYGGFGQSVFGVGVGPDPQHPEVNVLSIGQDGLGLPDRDYYLESKYAPQKAAYLAWIERALTLAGEPNPTEQAKAVLDLETKIAQVSWAADERRDIEKATNPMSVAELQAYAPGIDWEAYLAAAGAPHQARVILAEKSAIQKIAALYAETPLDTLKAWETFHVVDQASPYLSKRFVDSKFEFTKAMSGVTVQRPRWKRGVAMVEGALGESVGREYVARYFPPQSKQMMQDMVANLKTALAGRIEKLSWMAPSTKAEALKKLAKMDVMVGYPDKWRDYSGLKIDADDLYGDAQRSAAFEWGYQLSDLGKPVDHKKWGMTPQTVNAYNGFLENKIVFPAAILQPPFFDPTADPAVNYGAIGAVIGHEITHGFDDQGRKVDASGTLRDWWTPEDAKRFDAEAAKYGAQYDSYEPIPGFHVNGKLTMGENIADLGGLLAAIDAYHASLHGKPAPVVNGLTGDQRLFLGFAQVWRGKERDDALKQQMASDPHSPSMFRAIGPTRNIDAWYAAFGVKSGKYALTPDQRVRIW